MIFTDQALLRMLSTASFTGGVIILPSGRSITPGQLTALAAELTGDQS
jgi:hypothetical protein